MPAVPALPESRIGMEAAETKLAEAARMVVKAVANILAVVEVEDMKSESVPKMGRLPGLKARDRGMRFFLRKTGCGMLAKE